MSKLGSGNADGTFPKYLAVCGKQSYLAFQHHRSPNVCSILDYFWLVVRVLSTYIADVVRRVLYVRSY